MSNNLFICDQKNSDQAKTEPVAGALDKTKCPQKYLAMTLSQAAGSSKGNQLQPPLVICTSFSYETHMFRS